MSLNRKIISYLSILLIFSSSVVLSSCNNYYNDKLPVTDLGSFNLHTEGQQAYIDSDNYEQISAKGDEDIDKPNPVKFTIEDTEDLNNYQVYYSSTHKYNDPRIKKDNLVVSQDKNIVLTNLEFNKTYYFRIFVNDTNAIEKGIFKTTGGQFHNYDVDGIKNFRDLGGYQTELGYFKENMIYRCSELNHKEETYGEDDAIITPKGADLLINKLHIKSEIDLRLLSEDIPDKYKVKSILYDYGGNVNLFQLNLDWNGMHIKSESRRDKVQKFFEILSNKNNYPLLFHCHIGTDRTGMFAGAIHALLGGDITHIYKDYMFSNFANIGGSRSVDGLNNSFMNEYNETAGNSVSEKAYNLLNLGAEIPSTQLDSIRRILLK